MGSLGRKALLALVLLACPAWGQTVRLPAEVKVKAGRLAAVTVEWDGDDVAWTAAPQLDVFREYNPDPKIVRLRIIGYDNGTFTLTAVVCKDKKLSSFGVCNVVVGDAPPVPPGPTPDPPKPPEPPPSPAPIPVPGFRVLMVYESADLSKLPPAQLAVMTAADVRAYLNAKCVKGPDGKTAEWRLWDKDVSTSAESKLWQDAMARPRKSLPWLIVSNPEKGGGYEGPLPGTYSEMLKLLKSIGGE